MGRSNPKTLPSPAESVTKSSAQAGENGDGPGDRRGIGAGFDGRSIRHWFGARPCWARARRSRPRG